VPGVIDPKSAKSGSALFMTVHGAEAAEKQANDADRNASSRQVQHALLTLAGGNCRLLRRHRASAGAGRQRRA
jgi:hypothetical protein